MINEYCPKCHELTNMVMTTVEREETNNNNEVVKIITSSYQCNKCNAFVRSEDK